MDKVEQERRIEARKERKVGQPATYLITPQILTSSVENLSLDSPASSFFITLPGLIDELGVMLDYWPDYVKELIFLVRFENRRGVFERYVPLEDRITVNRLEEQIDKPCKVEMQLDEVRYHDDMREGRKRVFVPVHFSLVFRPDGRVCSKERM